MKRIAVLLLLSFVVLPLGSADTNPSYHFEIRDTGEYVTIPTIPDVGNLTGLFLTHGVTEHVAELHTDYGTLYIGYGKASRNRKGSYAFSFVIRRMSRTSSQDARIVDLKQVIVEDRGNYTSVTEQEYYYTSGMYAFKGDTQYMRDRSGNYTFFMNMYFSPDQNVTATSRAYSYIFIPFYSLSNETVSVHVNFTITLEVNEETYSLTLENDIETYSTYYEVRLGDEKTNYASVVIGERVPFRIYIYNPPLLALSLGSEYAVLSQTTLPNVLMPNVKLNVTYYRPPSPFGTGGLVGQDVKKQSIYDTVKNKISIFLPLTSQTVDDHFVVYFFYPKAYWVYVDPLLGTQTGAVRGVGEIILNAHSEYKQSINTVAVVFVVIMVLIAIVTLYIFLKTLRA